jgi:hypothetical protein
MSIVLNLLFGTALSLSKHTALRFEINHTQYQSYTDTSFKLPERNRREITLTPETNQIELDFIYRF